MLHYNYGSTLIGFDTLVDSLSFSLSSFSLFFLSLSLSPLFFPLLQSLTKSLARAQEKIRVLEEQIDQVLAEKNSLIQELEGRIRNLEQELQLARERAERLGQTVEQLEASRGEGESAMEAETLRETVDSLSQQLTTTLEEMEELRRQ